MGKTVLIALAGGGLSAVAALSPQLGLPGSFILACFAPLPLLVVGFARGLEGVGVAAATGTLVALAMAGTAAAAVFAGLHAVPAWLVVHIAIRGLAPAPSSAYAATSDRRAGEASNAGGNGATNGAAVGTILALLAIYAAVLAAITAIAASGDQSLEEGMRALLDQAVAASMGSLPAEARAGFVETAAPVFIGLFGISWQILIVVNALLAQRLVSRRGAALRPTPAWSALRLPEWLAWPLVAAAALALVSGGDIQYLARSTALILAAPYFFLGLVVVHGLARRTRAGGLLLAMFYIVLVLFTVIAGAVVAGLGMIEQWAGVRSRMGPPAQKE